YPADSTWRMNPIPACNCNKGYNCTIVDDPTIYTAYEDEKGDGVCKTGYQFKPLWIFIRTLHLTCKEML
ncbi:MAG: hypothetical protein CL756_00435, partial [Chloroflexi bacterium]|nr:hypothetical protein [Chloroflexota bacterium]